MLARGGKAEAAKVLKTFFVIIETHRTGGSDRLDYLINASPIDELPDAVEVVRVDRTITPVLADPAQADEQQPGVRDRCCVGVSPGGDGRDVVGPTKSHENGCQLVLEVNIAD